MSFSVSTPPPFGDSPTKEPPPTSRSTGRSADLATLSREVSRSSRRAHSAAVTSFALIFSLAPGDGDGEVSSTSTSPSRRPQENAATWGGGARPLDDEVEEREAQAGTPDGQRTSASRPIGISFSAAAFALGDTETGSCLESTAARWPRSWSVNLVLSSSCRSTRTASRSRSLLLLLLLLAERRCFRSGTSTSFSCSCSSSRGGLRGAPSGADLRLFAPEQAAPPNVLGSCPPVLREDTAAGDPARCDC
mmetsp:Transcript_14408/g.36005  ORF Transcript_14408/g.36005 Transcript_14408/m.36005 type:complete len:249 (-) Transcript_14408:3958-4704(-)